MVSIFDFKHCLTLFARKCTEVDCRQRNDECCVGTLLRSVDVRSKLRSLRCSQEQVWIRLCVSNLIARDDRDLYGIDVERSKIDRCCFHPAAGRDCPRYCGLSRPDEQFACAGRRADLARASLTGLGMTRRSSSMRSGSISTSVSRNSWLVNRPPLMPILWMHQTESSMPSASSAGF